MVHRSFPAQNEESRVIPGECFAGNFVSRQTWDRLLVVVVFAAYDNFNSSALNLNYYLNQ